MKKIVIAILVFLVICLPIGSSENRILFGVFIALWPFATIALLVLYIKWYDPLKNNKNKEIKYSNKNNDGNMD